jgi:hypothetical protein
MVMAMLALPAAMRAPFLAFALAFPALAITPIMAMVIVIAAAIFITAVALIVILGLRRSRRDRGRQRQRGCDSEYGTHLYSPNPPDFSGRIGFYDAGYARALNDAGSSRSGCKRLHIDKALDQSQ